MSAQATTVVARAEGATNQKSRGDPNQQIGVAKAAKNNINLKNLCVPLLSSDWDWDWDLGLGTWDLYRAMYFYIGMCSL